MTEPADDKPTPAAPKAPPALLHQLPKVAAAALVLSQIPWGLNIVNQFRMDQGPLGAWNLLVLLWCLATAFLLWRRFAPIFPLALITAWYVGILSTVFALTYEISFFWFALGTAGVAIVAITKAREGLPGMNSQITALALGAKCGS